MAQFQELYDQRIVDSVNETTAGTSARDVVQTGPGGMILK